MMKLKQFITLVGLLVLPSLLGVQSASIISKKYDGAFKDASVLLPANTDWRLLKAQCYQESRLNPLAVSPVGAYGLCQFMPGTAKDMKKRHPELTNFWLPEISIIAAARYMKQLNNYWSSERSQVDRYMLSLASYNAGAGHLTKAQKLCGMPVEYPRIVECLPEVTGHHSKETINYVENIYGKWYMLLLFE